MDSSMSFERHFLLNYLHRAETNVPFAARIALSWSASLAMQTGAQRPLDIELKNE